MLTTAVPAVLLTALLGAGQPPSAKTDSFRVVYEGTTKPDLAPIAEKMKERKILEGAAEMLSALKLPKTLTLKGSSCGEANAWYDSETGAITFCYELVRDFIKSASKSGK